MIPPQAATDLAYFAFKDVGNGLFVIELRDPAKIQEARAILSGAQNDRIHVSGVIVIQKASYNPSWSYHLAPDSITFFQMAMEVCDSTMQNVEEHLSEVGGAFLPNNRWCPWSSVLVKEVPRP